MNCDLQTCLDIAHDYACTLALSYAEVDLRELTARLVAAAAKRFPQLEVQADGDTGCTLVADEGRLSQVGEILIAHACEAARKRVVVQMACDGPSADVKWIVSDDGPPLPEEQKERLFTPSFTTRQGRPGLGLALAQKLVALHGGRISANQGKDGELRLSVYLPRRPPDLQAGEEVIDGAAKQV